MTPQLKGKHSLLSSATAQARSFSGPTWPALPAGTEDIRALIGPVAIGQEVMVLN